MKKYIIIFFILNIFNFGCGNIISDQKNSMVIHSVLGWAEIQNVNSINISNFRLAGNCTTQAGMVIIEIDNPALLTLTVPCEHGKYLTFVDLTVAALPQGLIELNADQSVINAVSATQLFVDTVVPSIPTITSPTNGSVIGSPTVIVDGTCEDGALVSVTGDLITINFTCIGGNFSEVITLSPGDGIKTISVGQTDPSGNPSPVASVTVNLNTGATLPLAPIITSPTNGTLSNQISQTITGTCETGATVNITGNITAAPVTTICVGGVFSQVVNLTAPDGVKTINATQTNVAGTSPSDSVNITRDDTAPSVLISSTSPSPTNVSPIPFLITFSEAVSGFTSSDISVVNGTVINFTGGPTIYNIQITPSSQNLVSVSVAAGVAQDLASNNNLISNTLSVDYQILNEFRTVWIIPGPNTNVALPLRAGSTYNFTINWGDGSPITTVTSNTDTDRLHTYTLAGTYNVTMTGTLQAWGINPAPSPCYITEVLEVGFMDWRNLASGFENCANLTNFANINGTEFSNVTSMSSMFFGATLVNPNTSNWNVSNVTNMSSMFQGAASANPNTSGWNTSNVTNMSNMFRGATIANPDTSGWNTANVTNMGGMFMDAPAANPNTSGWVTSNVTTMRDMFYNASNANPNTSGWVVTNVTNMESMFRNASVATPNTSLWNTSNVTTMEYMFAGASLANPDTSGWNTSNVIRMRSMFANTLNANPDVSGFDMSRVISIGAMFLGAAVATPNTSAWVLTNNTTCQDTFRSAPLANPDVRNWDMNGVTSIQTMFSGAVSATPDTSIWNTSTINNMFGVFTGAVNVNPNTTNWNVSNVTTMENMFNGATSAAPNTTNWNVSNVTTMASMFSNSAANPVTINWTLTSATNLNNMFNNSNINNLNYSNFLIRANATSPFNTINLGSIPASYQPAAAAARANLVGPRAWLINDLGAE